MPYQIDEEVMVGDPAKGISGLQSLDMGNPPKKQIPHLPYPKMVYLHPKDKTKEHRTKIVQDSDELDAAKEVGWQEKPHIPIEKPEDLSKEFDVAEAVVPLEAMSKVALIDEARKRGVKIDPQDKKEVILAAIQTADQE